MSSDNPVVDAVAAATQLLEQTQSLILASITADQQPLASYTPFVRDVDGSLVIAVSGLAAHGESLSSNPLVSVLLIEDEASARQVYARKRIVWQCEVQPLTDGARAAAFELLATRFGSMARLLEGLADFTAYRLRPRSGTFVMGFGAAYRMEQGDPKRLQAMQPQARG